MAKVNPQQFREKWGRRLKGAGQDIQAGINRVTEAPGQLAAAQKNKWVARMTDTAVQDKWADRVASVSLQEWKDKALNKGVGRIAAGVDGATAKVEKFASQLLPHIDEGRQGLASLPSVTLEDNINRAVTFMRHMAGFTFQR